MYDVIVFACNQCSEPEQNRANTTPIQTRQNYVPFLLEAEANEKCDHFVHRRQWGRKFLLLRPSYGTVDRSLCTFATWMKKSLVCN